MHLTKLELTDLRGAGAEPLTIDLARATQRAQPGASLAGWTVIAGPNGYGKTTILQALAASLVGAGGGRLLIGPNDDRWIRAGADEAVTTAWLRAVLGDDGGLPHERLAGLTRLQARWRRGGQVIARPGGSQSSLIVRQFWGTFAQDARPDGWLFVAYGPQRAALRSSNEAHELLTTTPPRVSAMVSLFRQDAALELGLEWLRRLAIERLREQHTVDASLVIDATLRILSDGLLFTDAARPARLNDEGELLVSAPGGKELPIAALGDGHRALLLLVLDLLCQVERFSPGRLLKDALRWLHAPDLTPDVRLSGVVVIDEPENHLHPALQQGLGFWLKTHFPNIQFIVCTHSALVCQAASPGGLFTMPRPFVVSPVTQETWEAVVNGSLDDAIMTELFGLDSPIAPEGQRLREELGRIEREMQRRPATEDMIRRREELLALLPSRLDVEVAEALRALAEVR